ncbi:hypothetical protein HHI36_010819 [Cryptolaemus montrouzieri]|uniref:Uncharacterized protein n=1 Tax=Cryptolaemus montrouzieri TaxID=559131 RepID=A0ABD2MJU0_9CUCU
MEDHQICCDNLHRTPFHFCKDNQRIRDNSPAKCQIKDCNHFIESPCHHHFSRTPPCVCCRACSKEPYVILPELYTNTQRNDTHKVPYVLFPESPKDLHENDKIVDVCKDHCYEGNPFIINPNGLREKCCSNEKNICLVSSNPNGCSYEKCSCSDSDKKRFITKCICCKTNGLQDNCKLCLMPRGRLGYLKNKK